MFEHKHEKKVQKSFKRFKLDIFGFAINITVIEN